MATVKFGKTESLAPAKEATHVPQALVETVVEPVAPAAVPALAVATVPPVTAPAVSSSPFVDDDNISADDLVLPRLNIVQKVGDLSNVFPHGSFILDGQLVLVEGAPLGKKSKPVKMALVGFKPTIFVEKVEGGGRGQVFKTEAEVAGAGGTVDWNDSQATGKPLYARSATALVMLEKPEGVTEDLFPHVIEGKNYALVQWTLKASGYTYGAKPIMSARKIGFIRTGGYRFGFWNVSTELKKFGQNFAYIPVPNPAGPTSEGFRAELKALLGY